MESLPSGFKSSEFWLKLIAVVIAAVLPVLPVGSTTEKIVTTVSVILAALGYGAMRTAVKTTALKADAVAAQAEKDPSQPAS